MGVDEGSDQKSSIYPHLMAANVHLKNEFTEDGECHKLMTWLKLSEEPKQKWKRQRLCNSDLCA